MLLRACVSHCFNKITSKAAGSILQKTAASPLVVSWRLRAIINLHGRSVSRSGESEGSRHKDRRGTVGGEEVFESSLFLGISINKGNSINNIFINKI